MGFLDGFLNKMNFSTTDEYDGDYDDMDMTEENEMCIRDRLWLH